MLLKLRNKAIRIPSLSAAECPVAKSSWRQNHVYANDKLPRCSRFAADDAHRKSNPHLSTVNLPQISTSSRKTRHSSLNKLSWYVHPFIPPRITKNSNRTHCVLNATSSKFIEGLTNTLRSRTEKSPHRPSRRPPKSKSPPKPPPARAKCQCWKRSRAC
jgi:hypothetical protein